MQKAIGIIRDEHRSLPAVLSGLYSLACMAMMPSQWKKASGPVGWRVSATETM